MMDYARCTRAVLAKARSGRVGVKDFEKHLPQLAVQLRLDAKTDLFDLWGRSVNVDEHEQALIVDPKLLNVVGRLAGQSIRDGQTYHAGLIHTYGYLLSLLPTRYGFKRERWVSGTIEAGLGLPAPLLPIKSKGSDELESFLQNVSYLLGQVSFTKIQQRQLATLPNVSPALKSKLSLPRTRNRIVEVTTLEDGSKLTLQTDLIKFKRSFNEAHALLVYSYRDSREQNRSRLVTCFPVSKQMYQELPQQVGRKVIVKPRYNLAVTGFPEAGLPGAARLAPFK